MRITAWDTSHAPNLTNGLTPIIRAAYYSLDAFTKLPETVNQLFSAVNLSIEQFTSVGALLIRYSEPRGLFGSLRRVYALLITGEAESRRLQMELMRMQQL